MAETTHSGKVERPEHFSAEPEKEAAEGGTGEARVFMSEEMREYFRRLEEEAEKCYQIARKARRKGLDPYPDVEIPRAPDLASRVEKQLADFGVGSIADMIRHLSKKHNREEVAILAAREYAMKHRDDPALALDRAVRIGLSILTEGILVAPLEGIVDVKVGRNDDGTTHAAIYFAGPIRSAGGTGQAMSVLIADVVRRELGIGAFKPTREEVERFKEEIPLYKQIQHLQYTPTPEEIETVVSNCPVCIDGEGTENREVSGFRDLPRVSTNRVRGGACLVIAEGMCQKASKILSHVETLGLDGWDWLKELVPKKKDDEDTFKVEPVYKYIKDIVAGRPVLAHPSKRGGFRLRYGRTRTTGLAAIGLSPASLEVFDGTIAIGTQIKLERPGKAGAVTVADSIDGPIVLLDNGDLVSLRTREAASALRDKIREIVDVGEILIPFGEFLENNHPLVPGAYAVERWVQEAKKAGASEEDIRRAGESGESAIEVSEKYGVPLHPDYNLFWHDLKREDVIFLSEYVEKNGVWEEKGNYTDRLGKSVDGPFLVLPSDEKVKDLLVTLGCWHLEREDKIAVFHYSYPLVRCLGLDVDDRAAEKGGRGRRITRRKDGKSGDLTAETKTALELVSHLAGFPVRPKAPTRIGARMGRPEKAKERQMNPPVHGLFPVGHEGGQQRLFEEASASGTVYVDVKMRRCAKCRNLTPLYRCEKCGGKTEETKDEPAKVKLNFQKILSSAKKNLGITSTRAKGVRGLISSKKIPETPEKGILRAKHDVWVFKDGTIRFDMTDLPLTHFRPYEIGLSVEKCHELGYTHDYLGNPLTDEKQIVELKVQDVVVSKSAGEYFVRVANFIDDLLENVYGMRAFYNVKKKEDLIGHLFIGLAPHTSGGVLVRLIGFTDAAAGFGHPFFHAAKRRNCDGDEDCLMLLLDGLLNFSKYFLPEKRGGLMDAPLVLSTRINPMEIDKEAHHIDISPFYPLEFYEMADRYASPKEVKCVEIVKDRLSTPGQYEGFRFTHSVENISSGVLVSSYKTLDSMEKKMEVQLSLARKIRAVDEGDTASRIINHHLLPDIIGNMRKFSGQTFRCTRCNTIYRRVPLAGKCIRPVEKNYFSQGRNGGNICGGNIVLTVSEKNVTKYLDLADRLAREFNVPEYTRQRIKIIEAAIESLFRNEKTRGTTLEEFLM